MKKIVFALSFIGIFLMTIVVFAEMPPPPPDDDNVIAPTSSTATLMRATNQSKVYEIKNGKRHWIPTAGVFNDYGFKWANIQVVPENTLNAYPRVKILKAIGSQTVYYLTESGMTRGMPSSEVFLSYGNKWEDVFEISVKELNAYEHNNLIRAEGDLKVYLIESGKKRWIESVKDFNNRKLNWSKIAPVNQTELNAYPDIGTVATNTPTPTSTPTPVPTTNYATTTIVIIPLGTSTSSTVDMGNFYTLRTGYLLNAQDSNRNFVAEFFPSTKLLLKYTQNEISQSNLNYSKRANFKICMWAFHDNQNKGWEEMGGFSNTNDDSVQLYATKSGTYAICQNKLR
jgi:hypothetical protein